MEAQPAPEAPATGIVASEVPASDIGEPGILAEVTRLGGLLQHLTPATTEREALDRVTAFEELKATLTATQYGEALGFEQLRIHRDALNNVPLAKQGVRAGDEIGLARKTSPGSGRKFLTTSHTVTDLPHTFAALNVGAISESKAQVVVDETVDLTSEQRRRVDNRLRNSLGVSGIKSLRSETRALATEIAAEAAADRAARAAANRRVTMTPLPHGMGRVSAILPLLQAVAVTETLKSGADTVVAQGQAEGRRHAQVMSDLLVERITGQSRAEDVPLEVSVVVETESLIAKGVVPAWFPGYGPWPAQEARNVIAGNRAKVFVRRLFVTPDEGQLVGMESTRRVFSGMLRRMVIVRDDVCRNPWCDAPIKHADHVVPVVRGGSTSWSNSSGLCASCNYAKEHPGWSHQVTKDGLVVATPTGREYTVTLRPFVTKLSTPRLGPEGVNHWRNRLSGLLDGVEDFGGAEDWEKPRRETPKMRKIPPGPTPPEPALLGLEPPGLVTREVSRWEEQLEALIFADTG